MLTWASCWGCSEELMESTSFAFPGRASLRNTCHRTADAHDLSGTQLLPQCCWRIVSVSQSDLPPIVGDEAVQPLVDAATDIGGKRLKTSPET
jgi:hypothetical protein